MNAIHRFGFPIVGRHSCFKLSSNYLSKYYIRYLFLRLIYIYMNSRNLACEGVDALILEKGILSISGNDHCNDCGANLPDWASISFGVLLCLDCSGYHRSFGVHITSVRSLKLDQWSTFDREISILRAGGNASFQKYVESLGMTYPLATINAPKEDIKRHLSAIYRSQELRYYKHLLCERVEGREDISFSDFKSRPSFDTHQEECSPLQDKSPAVLNLGANVTAAQRALLSGTKPSADGSHWIPDRIVNHCMICSSSFNIFYRKHHCRKCGKCVCASCAPAENTRPIMELGISEAVRHCKECYRSPIITWADAEDVQ